MTRHQAINILNDIARSPAISYEYGSEYAEAAEMAVRSLEKWGKLWRWLATLDHVVDSDTVLEKVDHYMMVIEEGEEVR